MKRYKYIEQLRSRLIDAQDGLLDENELQDLEKEAKAHQPQLWEDHCWMVQQKPETGLINQLSSLHRQPPDKGAIKTFHQRREAQGGSKADLEFLVWSWFRRYVLSTGLVLIVLFTSLQLRTTQDMPADNREQMAQFLGWEQDLIPELNHWLYDDL